MLFGNQPISRGDMPLESALELDFREAAATPDVTRSRRWRGVQVEFSRLRLPAEYAFQWSGGTHYLALHDLVLDGGEIEVDGLDPIAGGDLRNTMTYVPAGCELRGWARPAPRRNAFTVVYFEPDLIEREVQESCARTGLAPLVYFDDAALRATMRKLTEAMATADGAASSLYAETLGLVAVLETLRLQQGLAAGQGRTGMLTAAQEHLVRDYIEAHLLDDFGLQELAATTGLSRYHFSRRFKATFGMPPYQYVARRKIEQARRLLTETRFPLADVAAATGFRNTASLIRTFRDVTGTTPGDYRRTAPGIPR